MTRRAFLKTLAYLAAGSALMPFFPRSVLGQSKEDPSDRLSGSILTKAIPSSGEKIPVIGMGTWITFNIDRDERVVAQRTEVLKRFFDRGGGMIDSSPMYGRAEEVLGECLSRLGTPARLFAASKIWTMFKKSGPKQFNDSQRLWGVKQFDLFQVHNLLNWEAHLGYLNELKKDGLIRYVGITTSHGRRHHDLLKLMASEPLDFIQVTYNIIDREVEERILPMAADRGIAVIANRPYQRGRLIDHVKQYPLPEWAAEIDCQNWAQFLLKYIVSHPSVTVAIPATSQEAHMTENMGAAYGRLPDSAMRQKMADYVRRL